MDIKFISFSFFKGGAAIAAHKFYDIAKRYLKHNVAILSQENAGIFQFLKRIVSFALQRLQYDNNPIKHSLNLFSYQPVIRTFQNEQKSIYHLHWVNNDTLSVFDFNKIPSGTIITLHDEWLYCGSEHCYDLSDDSNDFIRGYDFFKKGIYGIHWNYIIWSIKFNRLANREDLIYTVPSSG